MKKFSILLLVNCFCLFANSQTTATLSTTNIKGSAIIDSMVIAKDTIVAKKDIRVVGDIKVKGEAKFKDKLKVDGDATFNGNLKNSALTGTGDRIVYVDAGGNFKTSPGTTPPGVNGPCVPGAKPWYEGGNANPANLEIGTCTNHEFILKTNGINRAWFQVDGTVSFGTKIISNTNGPEYKFDQGAIRLTGNNTYGGPQVVFHNLPTSPYGDWAIEYTGGTSAPNAGLNFWKPYASTNANNNILFLHDNNRIGMGTDNPTTRLTIDAWNDDGLLVKCDNNTSPKNAIDVFDKTNNKVQFRVKSNGETYARHMKVMVTAFPDYVFEKG